MTYAVAHALQAALFARLQADAPLAALIGPHLYDALPPGPLPSLYVAIGPEVASDRSDGTGQGAEYDLVLSVVSGADGFATAKAAASAVCDALGGPPQRWSSGMYARSTAPVYTWRGRPILVCGSSTISRHWAIHPGRRPRANSTVNIFVGKPIAW